MMSEIFKMHSADSNPCAKCGEKTLEVIRKSASTKKDEIGRMIGEYCQACGWVELYEPWPKLMRQIKSAPIKGA
jgi:hypothetical protein